MSPFFFVFVAVVSVFAGTSVVSFVRGQRLLGELRERFPAKYVAVGEPSYLSFAVMGRGFWRPVSAFNFFQLRRYQDLPDPGYIARAESVRGWQQVANYTKWASIGLMLVVAYLT